MNKNKFYTLLCKFFLSLALLAVFLGADGDGCKKEILTQKPAEGLFGKKDGVLNNLSAESPKKPFASDSFKNAKPVIIDARCFREDGTNACTGSMYDKYGFDKNRINAHTKTNQDARGFALNPTGTGVINAITGTAIAPDGKDYDGEYEKDSSGTPMDAQYFYKWLSEKNYKFDIPFIEYDLSGRSKPYLDFGYAKTYDDFKDFLLYKDIRTEAFNSHAQLGWANIDDLKADPISIDEIVSSLKRLADAEKMLTDSGISEKTKIDDFKIGMEKFKKVYPLPMWKSELKNLLDKDYPGQNLIDIPLEFYISIFQKIINQRNSFGDKYLLDILAFDDPSDSLLNGELEAKKNSIRLFLLNLSEYINNSVYPSQSKLPDGHILNLVKKTDGSYFGTSFSSFNYDTWTIVNEPESYKFELKYKFYIVARDFDKFDEDKKSDFVIGLMHGGRHCKDGKRVALSNAYKTNLPEDLERLISKSFGVNLTVENVIGSAGVIQKLDLLDQFLKDEVLYLKSLKFPNRGRPIKDEWGVANHTVVGDEASSKMATYNEVAESIGLPKLDGVLGVKFFYITRDDMVKVMLVKDPEALKRAKVEAPLYSANLLYDKLNKMVEKNTIFSDLFFKKYFPENKHISNMLPKFTKVNELKKRLLLYHMQKEGFIEHK